MVRPGRATVAHHGADVVTGVTALIRRGEGRLFQLGDPFRKPATPMVRVMSQPKTPGPVGVVCAQMCVGNLPTGRDPTRHRGAVPKLLGRGTYRRPLHFGPVRDIWDGHQPMSWQSPQPAGGYIVDRRPSGSLALDGMPSCLRSDRSKFQNPPCRQNNPREGGGSWG